MGDGNDDQGDAQHEPVASSTSDATSGTRGSMLAFRSVQQGNHRVGEDFLYELMRRPAGGRYAAVLGRRSPDGGRARILSLQAARPDRPLGTRHSTHVTKGLSRPLGGYELPCP